MARRGGFTIVELMITCAITAILIGSTASIYMFTANRTAQALATVTTSSQMQMLSKSIDETVAKATHVQVVSVAGNIGLKCIMPASGTDTDADAFSDLFEPTSATAGQVRWGKGTRVWFYLANATGNFMQPGPIVWRAERNDDLIPTSLNVDRSFTYFQDTGLLRYSLLDSITWSVNATDKTVTYTLKASSLARADRRSSTAYTTEKESSRTITLSRTTNWINVQ